MRKGLRRMLLAMSFLLGIVIVAIAPFFLLTPRAPAPPENLQTVEALEAYIRTLTSNETPPALEVVVSKGGAIVYAKAFGMSDGPSRRPATTQDIYHYWSLTKLFTATVVMQLADEGKLALEDPVTKFLPDFSTFAPTGERVDITVRQLLNHTSGMGDLKPTDLAGWIHHHGDQEINQRELVQTRMQSYGKLTSHPGTVSSYSNAGYVVLGAIIEVADGRNYEEVVRNRVLQPLNMTSTDFIYRDDMRVRASTGSHPVFHFFTPLLLAIHWDWFSNWVAKTERWRMWLTPLHTDYTGPTGLMGTGRDLARFGEVFAMRPSGQEGSILKTETVARLLHSEFGGRTGADGDRMGLGWHWFDREPLPFKGHGGAGPGFGAQLAVFPELEMVIVVLANDTLINRVALTNLVARVFK